MSTPKPRNRPASERGDVVAYIPVLHEGYRRLIDTADPGGTVFVLGDELTAEFDQFRKEIRALPAELIAASIRAWELGPKVVVADRQTLERIPAHRYVTLPDEDVSHEIAARYLGQATVNFHPVFLRWDRVKSLAEEDVQPDETVSNEELDRSMIRLAQKKSTRSSDWWRRVGCVLTKEDEIIFTAANEHFPSPHSPWAEGDPRNNFKRGISIEFSTALHAEASVIAHAAREGIRLTGSKLYVSVFPCQHCAKLIAAAGIAELYYRTGYSLLDGARALKTAGVRMIRVDGVAEPPPDGPEWVEYRKAAPSEA